MKRISDERKKQGKSLGDYFLMATDLAYDIAEENDCIVRHAAEDELLMDLDEGPVFFEERYEFFNDICPGVLKSYELLPSRNGNTHAIVKLHNTMGQAHRLLLQAVLGSDLNRELFNTARMIDGNTTGNVLFRPRIK